MTHFRPALLALLGALTLTLGACASSEPASETSDDPAVAQEASDDAGDADVEDATVDGAPLQVVVTTGILGDIATRVLEGTGAEIEVLMPSGVDPHAYEPSAADGLALREADFVVANGLQLEESLLDVLEAAEGDGVAVLEVGEELDNILEVGEEGADHDHDHGDDEHADEDEHGDEGHANEGEGSDGHDHGAFDPHVWLDPLNVAEMAEIIATEYGELAPGSAEAVEENAAAVATEMQQLDAELQELVATLDEDQRKLVTNHDALGYLAAHYGFEVIGTVLPGTSTDVDTTAAGFTELAETIRDAGVPAIFAETTSSDRLAQSLAEEVGDVEVVSLYTGSLGEPGSGADTVSGMIRTNIERIVAALG